MRTLTYAVLRWGFAGLAAAWAWPAFAQDASERERDLMVLIKALEERISQLEEQLREMKASPEIEQRVTELETKMENAPVRGENDFQVFWRDGLNLETANKKFRLKIGGRIQNDWAWFDDGREFRVVFGDVEDGTEFRRARLAVEGEIYENYEFKAEYDFAGGDADFRDVYLGMKAVPIVGNVRVGQFKEPFSLEELTSDSHITFLERGLPNVFAPQRSTGLQLTNTLADERMTWAVGVFRDTDDYGNGSDDGGYNLTGRITGLPWYRDDGRKLLHLGASYSHQNVDGVLRYRQRPEANLAGVRYVDTGAFPVDDVDLYNAELALVYGPVSFQAEYMKADADSIIGGEESFDGWYAFVSWFLTGEHRPYKKDAGVFDKIKPKRNFGFGEGDGWGAWELALRYSTLDLDDKNVRGGEETNWTVGLNWYLNTNLKVMLNYVHADIDRFLYKGDIDVFQTRFQVFW